MQVLLLSIELSGIYAVEWKYLSLTCLPSKIAGVSLIIGLPYIPAAVNTVCLTLQTEPLGVGLSGTMSGALALLKSCPQQWCGCCAGLCDNYSKCVYCVSARNR